MNPFVLLFGAIGSEVVATTALKLSDGFSRPLPSLVVVAGYGISFYLLALCLKELSVGTTYAIWSGVGTAAIALVGVFWFHEALTLPRVAGILLIIAGVALVNSGAAAH